MSAYRYYSRERQRHPDISDCTLSKERTADVLQALNRFQGLPPIQLKFHKRPKNAKRPWSWYQSGYDRKGKKRVEEHISMEEGMLSLRHVAHEWAHYAHRHDYKARQRANSKIPPERSHGPQHLAIFERAVTFLKTNGYAKNKSASVAPGPRKERVVVARGTLPAVTELLVGRDPEKLSADEKTSLDLKVREQYMASLPAKLTCPKCHQELEKELFGARVMSRTPQGLPQRVARQSQCRPCRNQASVKTD